MASNENDRRPGGQAAAGPSAEEIIESVRADLAAIDARVFRGAGTDTLDEHLSEIRAAAALLFGAPHG